MEIRKEFNSNEECVAFIDDIIREAEALGKKIKDIKKFKFNGSYSATVTYGRNR